MATPRLAPAPRLRTPALPSPTPAPGGPALAPPPPVGGRGRALIVEQQPGQPARARVIGALKGDAVQLLLAAVDRGVTLLDLLQVDDVDETAVRAVAELLPRRCVLVACPRWLELWIGHVRWQNGDMGRVA